MKYVFTLVVFSLSSLKFVVSEVGMEIRAHFSFHLHSHQQRQQFFNWEMKYVHLSVAFVSLVTSL